jgi:hypothetical protein
MLYKTINFLEQIDHLLRNKATGTPAELARKLGISERAWYKLRDELVNDLELPIAYCPHRKSYVYTQEGRFLVGFKPLGEDKKATLGGGSGLYPLKTLLFTNFFCH